MPEAGLQELLEAGVHFGHQTRRWNPNMRRFIFTELDGIHIIDLLQTEALLENARRFVGELASGGGTVLFVGTKKQARDVVQEWAERCKMPYVNKRWLGGLLTNFQTMSGRIARLHELNGWKEEGKLDLLPTKERMKMEAELAKLEFNLGGVRDMDRLPDAVFVTDLKTEEIAVHEAARLRIPIIGLVDTNCDPTPVDYVIPGNDDAIRSCQLIIGTIGSAVEEGSSAWRVQEEKRIAEEMERRKRDEEERKKREEEEKVRLRPSRPKKPRKKRPNRRRRKRLPRNSRRRPPLRRKRRPPAEAPKAAQAARPPRPRRLRLSPPRPRLRKAEPAAPARGAESSRRRDQHRHPERGFLMAEVTAAEVKALRERTGAALMDSKAALVEADGNVDRAIELLRVKGQASAAKREGRGTNEGVVSSYIHANNSVGAMVEVQCETDFVSRNEDFQVFAYQVALHVAATAPLYVSTDEIDPEAREAERRVFEEKAREEGKPDNIVEKIVEGQLKKWGSEVALLDQQHVNAEKHGSKTIEELRQELAAKTGENIRIARFSYFKVGAE